jgi:hypothetical protein
MERVNIQVSPRQMSKLRDGQKVRIKKPKMAGEGISLIVSPDNYSIITRSFTRNKGGEIVLSPQEILMNKEQAPSMQGQGIFGSKFDAKAKEVFGEKGKKKVYRYAREVLNPLAKASITAGLVAGATSASVANPALAPYLATAVPAASYFAYDYLDNPRDYQSSSGKQKAKQYLEQQSLDKLNSELGTNMGYLSKAGMKQALEDKAKQQLTQASIQAQQSLLISRLNSGLENVRTLSPEEKQLLKGTQYEYMIGGGLYPMNGNGLYAGSAGRGLTASSRRGGAIIGNNGGFVRGQPQALQSQPSSTNFQFRYTLPVALQQMIER